MTVIHSFVILCLLSSSSHLILYLKFIILDLFQLTISMRNDGEQGLAATIVAVPTRTPRMFNNTIL